MQVAASFIWECRRFSEHQFLVLLGPGLVDIVDREEFPSFFEFDDLDFGVISARKIAAIRSRLSGIEEAWRPDCIITTSGPPYWRSRAPHVVGFNRPMLIYPESPYISSLSLWKKARLSAQGFLHRFYFRRDSDAIIVQTDDVNQRVRQLLGKEQVYTVTNTHSGWYDEPAEFAPRLPERTDGVFRFLTLTSYYPHKNLDLIPKVIEALPPDIRSRVEFVLTLTESQYRQSIGTDIPAQIRLIGPVPPQECPSLYRECDAMFLPTLAECFSASYPEAMKMEKPIITTDLGFARSICGDAALFFKAGDPRSAADRLLSLVSDEQLQARLRTVGRARLAEFDNAARRAEKILEICEELVPKSVLVTAAE